MLRRAFAAAGAALGRVRADECAAFRARPSQPARRVTTVVADSTVGPVLGRQGIGAAGPVGLDLHVVTALAKYDFHGRALARERNSFCRPCSLCFPQERELVRGN